VPGFNTIYETCLSVLEQMDGDLEDLLAYIPAWVAQIGSHSTFPVLNTKDLQDLSRGWMASSGILRDILTTLQKMVDPATIPSSRKTG
jgi:hypothetical protein